MINPRPGVRRSAHQRRRNVEYCLFHSQREKKSSYRHADMTSQLLDFRGMMVHCRKPEPDFQKLW